MGILVKLGYDGIFYGGMAKQPNLLTIQEALEKSLKSLNYDTRFLFLSRTDRGVHAVNQLVLLHNISERGILKLSNNLPHGIYLLAYSNVPNNFHLRKSVCWKTYLYIAPNFGEDLKKLSWGCEYISSRQHDFRGLSKRRKIRENTIMKLDVKVLFDDDFQYFYVRGKAFLWEQVRRIITFLKYFALGRMTEEDFKFVLKGNYYRKGIPPAPAEGLILWKIELCKKISWKYILPEKIFRKMIFERVKRYSILFADKWVL